MNKQQAISLKLAQWLGRAEAIKARNDIRYAMTFAAGEFNPFANTTEGRAQFAECVIEAAVCDDIFIRNDAATGHVEWFKKDCGWEKIYFGVDPEKHVSATLEAIYLALGGTDS